jgi:DNA-binding response OmpR family regulator
VLIADNDRGVSGLLTEVLSRAGVPVVHAYDGEAAQRLAADPAIRVVVTDLDMPGASGLDVVESLRSRRSPPLVIVISGYLDAEVRTKLGACPFVREVLGKPFDLLAFASRVRDLLAAAAAGSGAGGGEADASA